MARAFQRSVEKFLCQLLFVIGKDINERVRSRGKRIRGSSVGAKRNIAAKQLARPFVLAGINWLDGRDGCKPTWWPERGIAGCSRLWQGGPARRRSGRLVLAAIWGGIARCTVPKPPSTVCEQANASIWRIIQKRTHCIIVKLADGKWSNARTIVTHGAR